MASAHADDSAHGHAKFDEKLDVPAMETDHRSDEEIAATIKEEALGLGSGKDVMPMTVGIARGRHLASLAIQIETSRGGSQTLERPRSRVHYACAGTDYLLHAGAWYQVKYSPTACLTPTAMATNSALIAFAARAHACSPRCTPGLWQHTHTL